MHGFRFCQSRFAGSVFGLDMKICAALIACLGALALPASALAARCAPPGNSGVSQYYETIPGPSCNTGPGGHGHHHGGGGGISKHTAHQLGKHGPTGQAVAQLVASTGTVGTTPNGTGLGTGATAGSGNTAGSTGTATSGSTNNGQGNGAGGGHRATGGGAAGGSGASAPNVDGRGLVSALLHPILTGASGAGGAGPLLPIFLGGALLLFLAGLAVRRRRARS
jgi:hypothetical protein